MKVVDMHCDTISELFYRKEEGRGHSVWKNDCHEMCIRDRPI